MPADPTTAVKWLNQAAGEGDARAQNEIGLQEGDAEKAVHWYRLAAEQRYAPATGLIRAVPKDVLGPILY